MKYAKLYNYKNSRHVKMPFPSPLSIFVCLSLFHLTSTLTRRLPGLERVSCLVWSLYSAGLLTSFTKHPNTPIILLFYLLILIQRNS